MGSRFNLDHPGISDLVGENPSDERLFRNVANRVVNWDALPGATVRYGLAGRWALGAGTTTIRVRAQGTVEGAIDGNVVHSFALNESESGPRIDRTAFLTKPAGASFVKVTAENAVFYTTRLFGGVLTLEAPDGEEGILLSRLSNVAVEANGGVEVVRMAWVVDFDALGSGSEIVVGFGGLVVANNFGEKRIRIRIGGAFNAIDGDVALDYNELVPFTVHLRGVQATIPRPTGKLPVKLTLQTTDGGVGSLIQTRLVSLILRAA